MSNNNALTVFRMRLLQNGYYLFDKRLFVAELRCQAGQVVSWKQFSLAVMWFKVLNMNI